MVCTAILYWCTLALKEKRRGALVYLVGFLALFASAINDILHSLLLIKTGYYLGLGLFALILSQSSFLALRFSDALKTEETLKNDLEILVKKRTEELYAQRNEFEHLSNVDPLTHLYNRRYLSDALSIEFEGFQRYQSTFCVLIIDIDYFKNVNDLHGHLVGDEILVALSSLILENTRKTDVLGRFGGEEFVLMMRYTDATNALKHADRLRILIETHTFITKAGPLHITISFGVSEVSSLDKHEEAVLHRADLALYQSKNNGRNQVNLVLK